MKSISHSDLMNFVCYVAEKLTAQKFGDFTIIIETEYGSCYTKEAQEVFDRYYDLIEDKLTELLHLEFDYEQQVWNCVREDEPTPF